MKSSGYLVALFCSGLLLLRAELEEEDRRSEQWRQKWFKISNANRVALRLNGGDPALHRFAG